MPRLFWIMDMRITPLLGNGMMSGTAPEPKPPVRRVRQPVCSAHVAADDAPPRHSGGGRSGSGRGREALAAPPGSGSRSPPPGLRPRRRRPVAQVGLASRRAAPGDAHAAVVLSAAIYGAALARLRGADQARDRHPITPAGAGSSSPAGGPRRRAPRQRGAGSRPRPRGAAEAMLCEAGSRTTSREPPRRPHLLGSQPAAALLLVSDPLHGAGARDPRAGLDAAPAPTPTTRFTGKRSRLRFLLRESSSWAPTSRGARSSGRPTAGRPGELPPCE